MQLSQHVSQDKMLPFDDLDLDQTYTVMSAPTASKFKLRGSTTASDLNYRSDLALPVFFGYIFMG